MISPLIMSNLPNPETLGDSLGVAHSTGGGSTGSIFAQLFKKVGPSNTASVVGTRQASAVALKGHALVAKLKQSLMASGVPLDKLVAGNKALAAMQKVLDCAGFNPDQVQKLMDGLKADARGQGVKLSTLFERISQLKEPAAEKSGPTYLEISAVPYLETALQQFGLSREEVTSVLGKAKVEGKGIDVRKLADALKLMGGGVQIASTDAQSIEKAKDLLQRIGLDTDATGKNVVNLAGLVSALEKFAAHKSPKDQKEQDKSDGNAAAAAQSLAQVLPAQHRAAVADGAAGGSDSTGKAAAIAMKAFQQLVLQQNGAGKNPTQPQGTGRMSLENFAGALEKETKRPGGLLHTPVAQDWRDTVTGEKADKTGGDALTPKMKAALAAPAAGQGQGNSGKSGVSGLDAQTALKLGQADGGRKEDLVKTVTSSAKPDDAASALLAGGPARPTGTVHSAAQPAVPQPAPRTLPYYVLDQVSRQILRSRFFNEKEIQLQLKPPSLGKLKLSIENTTTGIKVNIIADNHAARNLLISHSGDLKNALMDQGIRLNRLDVDTQAGGFGQSMADARQGSEQFQGRKGFSGPTRVPVDTLPQDGVREPVTVPQTSALNLVA